MSKIGQFVNSAKEQGQKKKAESWPQEILPTHKRKISLSLPEDIEDLLKGPLQSFYSWN